MRRVERGNSLLTTLVWIALIVCLAFGLAGLTVSHLTTINHQDNRQQARLLARSAVSTAIARLMQDTDFGKATKPSGLVTVTREDGVGYLTFESQLASDKSIPYSSNNLEMTTAASGSEGRIVPKNSAYLVGIGRSGGVTQRVEAILAVPPFPYAIAASGSVEARGGLTIGALKEVPEGDIPDSGTFLPADLLANDTGTQSVFLGSDTHISGDVRAVGDIVLDPEAAPETIQVKGQLRSRSAAEKIPTVDLKRFDPIVSRHAYTPLSQAVYDTGQTKLGGENRREGPLTINHGLYLDGGVLFVNGDLTVHGGLTGKGTVAANGKVTITGQSDFLAGGAVAVLSAGDFELKGSDAEGSYFQGLVYTEGSFVADKVTLVGSLVAAGDPKPVRLRDSRVFQAPPAPPEPGQPLPSSSPAPPSGGVSAGPVLLQSNGTRASMTLSPGSSGQHLHIEIQQGNPRPSIDFDFAPTIVGFQPLYNTDPDGPVYKFFREHGFTNEIAIAGALSQSEQLMLSNQPTGSGPTPTSGGTGPANTAVSLMDPSSFLRLSERIRVVMWKEE